MSRLNCKTCDAWLQLIEEEVLFSVSFGCPDHGSVSMTARVGERDGRGRKLEGTADTELGKPGRRVA